MKLKYIFFGLFFTVANPLFAQNNVQPAFTGYAEKQSELMQKAYEKHDAEADRDLVEGFVSKYNNLNKDDKAYFSGNVVGAYYNLSCAYAVLNNKVRAIQYLDSAIAKGYTDYKHLQEDSDFNSIKTDPGFLAMGKKIRSTGDYLYILQKAGKYDNSQIRPIPSFTYQAATAPELVALRKKFKLDSIAGAGTDVSKMIRILHWVHNTVNHDGQHESGIKLINADEIIGAAQTRKLGVSCGELASVLQDCYLAMGWKVRKVYCFPKDSLNKDYDSHVINVVFLTAKQKWIWMDPTNNAYVTDNNGEMLSIEEVREHLVNNKPLVLNTDANWNNRQVVTKENYLYNYMAKNLYMLYSPLRSEYDYQTPGKNSSIGYVTLLPLEYFKQAPNKTETFNKETKTAIARYRTNNEKQFWRVGE